MNERERMLRRLQAEEFAVYETVLYLDGHPVDETALQYYAQHRDLAAQLRAEYENRYGGLTVDSVNISDNDWHWIDHPWPWEREAN